MGHWDCTEKNRKEEEARKAWVAADEKYTLSYNTYVEAVRLQTELNEELGRATTMNDGYSAIKDSVTNVGDPISSSSNMEIIDSGCKCVGEYKQSIEDAIKKCDEEVEKWELQSDADEKDLEAKETAYYNAQNASCDWIPDDDESSE
jgi:hypothetical protein